MEPSKFFHHSTLVNNEREPGQNPHTSNFDLPSTYQYWRTVYGFSSWNTVILKDLQRICDDPDVKIHVAVITATQMTAHPQIHEDLKEHGWLDCGWATNPNMQDKTKLNLRIRVNPKFNDGGRWGRKDGRGGWIHGPTMHKIYACCGAGVMFGFPTKDEEILGVEQCGWLLSGSFRTGYTQALSGRIYFLNRKPTTYVYGETESDEEEDDYDDDFEPDDENQL